MSTGERSDDEVPAGARDALRALRPVLDAEGELERDVLADARAITRAPGEERVETVLRSEMGPRRTSWRRSFALAAAMLVAVASILWFARSRRTDPTREGTLGAPGLEILRPRGEVDEYAPFEWRYDRDPDATFVVHVVATATGKTTTSRKLDMPAWTPSADELDPKTPAIEWQVTVFDSSGTPIADSPRVSASLR